MKRAIQLRGAETLLVKAPGGDEYPEPAFYAPCVVLRGDSEKHTSSVKIIYEGPIHGGQKTAETRCASIGYLAMAILEKGIPGNLEDWIRRAAKSCLSDGLAAEAEWVRMKPKGKRVRYLFHGRAAEVLRQICRDALTQVPFPAPERNILIRMPGYKILLAAVETMAAAR